MKSVWSKNYDIERRKPLKGDIKAEVVVIGAGIAGLLTAYMLRKRDVEVVVIDKGEISKGNTENTTAKITIQHNIIYDKLIKEFGEENAKKYANANKLAMKNFKEIIEENNIECDFEVEDSYIYSLNNSNKIIKEYEAATRIGIDAELVDEIELPFKIAKAIKFKNQAQFNPIKFLNYIAKDLTIYEDTKAIDIKEDVVITKHGSIKAKSIVVATHFPIINTPGYYFLRMHQEREHLIALKDAQIIKGMYLDEKTGGYTFRRYKDLLIMGGLSKRTGSTEVEGNYSKIRELAKKLYPQSVEKYNWSAQDCMTSDGIPYIGTYSKEMPNVYVATGFNKWGMTSAMVSAIIISDMIAGVEHDFNDIFSPSRFDMTASIKNMLNDGFETTYNFIAQKIHIPMQTVEYVKNGEGEIIIYNGEKVGVYKDNNGNIYTVSTKCPHLGCELKWNAEDLSWDCPCHGSRFDFKGKLLDSPSIKDLRDEK